MLDFLSGCQNSPEIAQKERKDEECLDRAHGCNQTLALNFALARIRCLGVELAYFTSRRGSFRQTGGAIWSAICCRGGWMDLRAPDTGQSVVSSARDGAR